MSSHTKPPAVRIRDALEEIVADNSRLLAENQQLREALREITDPDNRSGWLLRSIARRALAAVGEE